MACQVMEGMDIVFTYQVTCCEVHVSPVAFLTGRRPSFDGFLFGARGCSDSFLQFTGGIRSLSKIHMGVSVNGGTPKTPQNDHF